MTSFSSDVTESAVACEAVKLRVEGGRNPHTFHTFNDHIVLNAKTPSGEDDC